MTPPSLEQEIENAFLEKFPLFKDMPYHKRAGLDIFEAGAKWVMDREKELITVLEMVEDNRKMPHKHADFQIRLHCLAERAREVLDKRRNENERG